MGEVLSHVSVPETVDYESMRRRRLLLAALILIALPIGVYLFARFTLGSDLVRTTLERQLSARLGQPVHIRTATAGLFPRVALRLQDVTVGSADVVHIGDLQIVTGLRGLLSRTVTDAEVIASTGTVRVPLPFSLTPASPPASAPADASSLAIVSIRTIRLREITLATGRHSLIVDLDSSLEGDRLNIGRAALRTSSTRLEASGTLALSSMEGSLEARADPLDLDEAIAIASAMATPAPAAARPQAGSSSLHLVVRLSAPKATYASYLFEDVAATLDLAPRGVTLSPLSLRSFGGRFQGRLDAETTREVPLLRLSGRAEGFDVAELLKASGSPGGITGRLAGTVSVSAAGTEIDPLIRSARGTIGAVVTDGAIPGLEMVRQIVLAFGKPSGAPAAGSGSAFSRLGGTFALASGALSSEDLAMASRDFDMTGRGTMRLASGDLDARVNVILSPELTAQAGTDLRRYAQQDGRVVVPATIGGTLPRPAVALDVASATRRALENELRRRATTFIDGLFKKRKDK
jgi:uncharacterized protein involved in outer membrane biogenesis